MLVTVLTSVGLLCYCYLLCLLMALYVDVSIMSTPNSFPSIRLVNVDYNNSRDYINNCLIFLFLCILRKYNAKNEFLLIHQISPNKHKDSISLFGRFMSIYTYWMASICILLIIISNPGIINPGPHQHTSKNNISIVYHNSVSYTHLTLPTKA